MFLVCYVYVCTRPCEDMCAGLRLIGNFSVTPSPTVLSELASVSLDQQLTDWTRLIGWRASEICLVHVVWGSELGSSCFAQPTCTVPTLSSEAALCGMHLLPPCLENKKKKKMQVWLEGIRYGSRVLQVQGQAVISGLPRSGMVFLCWVPRWELFI